MIDLNRLLKLRLVVARHGEMDRAGWWNTNGMLGRYGAIALSRGLPRTHRFAQARVVFNVAQVSLPGALRCSRLGDPLEASRRRSRISSTSTGKPGSVMATRGTRSSTSLADCRGTPTSLSELRDRDLLSDATAETIQALRRSAEGRAVPLPGEHAPRRRSDHAPRRRLLKGEQGAPAIPYARLAD